MQSGSGSFFSSLPTDPGPDPEPVPRPAWLHAPVDLLPGRVVIDEVLHRSAHTVVWLREARVFDEGVELRLGWARRRRPDESARDWQLQTRRVMHATDHELDGLLVGIGLPDGRRVLPRGFGASAPGAQSDPEPPTLMALGGGGGGDSDLYSGRMNAWLWWPSRPLGDLDVWVRWGEIGMDDVRHRISGQLLATAPSPRPLWP